MITSNKDVLHTRSIMTPRSEVQYLHGALNREVSRLSGRLQGLAACQIGKHYRMFVVRDPKTREFEYIINPKVLFKFGVLFKDEGCLSENGRYIVARPIFSIVQYETMSGDIVKKFLFRKKTRIFMHEMDHLNGISLSDKKVSIRI